jgi:hypothetical protein
VRKPEEQEEFLQHGRFGEGRPSQLRTAFSTPVIVGIAFIVLGFVMIGIAVVFKIGRDDGGPFFLMGFFGSLIVGFGFFVWVLAIKIVKLFKH